MANKTNITKVKGYELVPTPENKLIFQEHEYVGKEPDTKFVYNTIKKVANRVGMKDIHVASWDCADEENGIEKMKLGYYFGKAFTQHVIGPNIFSQPVSVSAHKGHSSNIFIFSGHYGVWQRPSDKRILCGYVESERDGTLRPTCGAMGHVLNRLIGKEEVPKDLPEWDEDKIGKIVIGLMPFKDQFRKIYDSGADHDEKMSRGMDFMVRKNIDVMTSRLVGILKGLPSHGSDHDDKKLVFGMLTMNRCKYSDTALITHAYLIEKGIVYDLREHKI